MTKEILIIDDNIDIRNLISSIVNPFERIGYPE